MIVTLSGSNSFLLSKKLRNIVDSFVKDNGDLALERIDASEVEVGAINEAILSMPFLAARKMVLLRELAGNKAAADSIEQIISSVPDSTDLIIYEPKIDKRSGYFKVLKNQTQYEEFNELDSNKLSDWLTGEAKNLGAQLTKSDALYLVDRLGTNQAILFSELEKLALGDKIINRQNIDEQTEKNPQSRVFDLLDAAFSGNKKQALGLYEEQRAQKVEPQAILALIVWQLHILAIAWHGRNKSAEIIAKEAGLSPYPVTKAQRLAAKISEDKLKLMVHEALNMDIKSKSVNLDLDEALKNFLISL
jgi:DNA polymerase-3 subunit delta